jgi:hypothetical protein
LNNQEFWERVLQQLRDLFFAILIVVKEAVFALVVLAASRGIAWFIRFSASDPDTSITYVKRIGDFGAIILFVVLVGKDLVDYFRQK